MRKILSWLSTAALTVVVATGCTELMNFGDSNSAQGSTYEVLVVCDATEWHGGIEKVVREQLERPIEMINQFEPCFKLTHITHSSYKGSLLTFRNIVIFDISAKHQQAKLSIRHDVHAAPQTIITISAPSVVAATQFLTERSPELEMLLEEAERNRTIEHARQHSNTELSQQIEEEFGIRITIPEGYALRAQNEDFLWASCEYKTASQGFFIYSYDPNKMRNHSLVDARNLFARRIPGPKEGSYMTTVTQIPDISGDTYTPIEPDMRQIDVNGRKWVEMRGLWNVENYQMGGPFVSFTTYNEATGRMIVLDCYVYSPKDGKRNLLRALEHLVWLVEFPAEVPAEEK